MSDLIQFEKNGVSWWGRQDTYGDDKRVFDEILTYDIGPGPVRSMIEIGGHIGTFTAYIKHLYPDAFCVVYEPALDNFAILQRNMADFGRSVKTYMNPVGYSKMQGYVVYHPDHSTCHRVDLAPPAGLRSQLAARWVTFEEALQDFGGNVDLLKIDAEGAEVDIFANCTDVSVKRVRRYVGEFHNGIDYFMSTIGRRFQNLGYEVKGERDPNAHSVFSAWRA